MSFLSLYGGRSTLSTQLALFNCQATHVLNETGSNNQKTTNEMKYHFIVWKELIVFVILIMSQSNPLCF